jgi:hypothetical protein
VVDAVGQELAVIAPIEVVTARVLEACRDLRLRYCPAEMRRRFLFVARRGGRVLLVRVLALDMNRDLLAFGALSTELISLAALPSLFVDPRQCCALAGSFVRGALADEESVRLGHALYCYSVVVPCDVSIPIPKLLTSSPGTVTV